MSKLPIHERLESAEVIRQSRGLPAYLTNLIMTMHLILSVDNKLFRWCEGDSLEKLDEIILKLQTLRDTLPETKSEGEEALKLALQSQQPLEIAAPS